MIVYIGNVFDQFRLGRSREVVTSRHNYVINFQKKGFDVLDFWLEHAGVSFRFQTVKHELGFGTRVVRLFVHFLPRYNWVDVKTLIPRKN